MNSVTILHFGSFIAYILLIALVLGRRPGYILNRVCALLMATFAYWSLFSALFTMAGTSQQAMLYINISSLGWCFMPVGCLWFCLALDSRYDVLKNRAFITLSLLTSAAFVYAQWQGQMLYMALPAEWGWTPIWNMSIAAYAYYVYYFIICCALVYLLIDFGRKARSHSQKMQARLLLITGIITMLLSTATDIVFRIFDIRAFPDISNVFFTVLALGIVFAVLRYGLMSLTPTVAAETILSTIGDSIILLDTDLQIVYVNQETTDLLGCKENDLLGDSFISINEDKNLAENLLEETLRAGRVNREISYRSRSDQSVPVLAATSIICNDAGDVIGVVISAKDISERKKAEEAVRQSEEKYRLVVDNAQETIFINMDGKFTFANNRAALLGGYSVEELSSRPFIEFIHPDDREIAMERHLRRLKGLDVPDKFTFRVVINTGDTRWAELTTVPINWEGRSATLNFLTDITERRQAEHALKESEAQYRLLAEHTTDFVWLMDMNLKPIYQSPSAEKLTGFTRQELLELPFEKRVTPQSLKVAAEIFFKEIPRVEHDRDYNPVITLDLEVYRKDNSTLWSENKFSVIRDANGKAVSIIGEARDVSERKKAEEALQTAENTYRLLAEHMLDIVWMMDLDLKPVWMSQSCERVSGYTLDELMALPPEKQWTPQTLAKSAHLLTKWKSIDREGRIPDPKGTISTELEFVCKDGHIILMDCSFQFIRDETGKATGILAEGRDITARRAAERARDESERTYRLLAEHMSDVVWMMDLNLNVTWLSQSSERVRGYSLEETMALPLEKQMTPDSLGKSLHLLGKWAQIEREGRTPEPAGSISTEVEFTCKDGSTVLLDCTFQYIRDEQGRATGILAEGRDITARKKAEDALRVSEERWQFALEGFGDGVWDWNAETNQVYYSPQWKAVLGYQDDEISNTLDEWDKRLHPDDRERVFNELAEHFDGKTSIFMSEYRLRCKDNNYRWMLGRGKTITWMDDGKPLRIVGTQSDITERRRFEEEQQRVGKLESVGLLAGGIAHDFNNILTAIMGNISLASMEAGEGTEIRDRMEEAQKALLRAKGLTQQLLTFSMGGAPVKKLASLTELLRDTATFSLAGSNVKCRFHIPTDLWHVEVDAGQVSQVIHNLVLNAQQSMPLGGTIELAAENFELSDQRSLGRGLPLKPGKYVRVAVTDYGSGIPAEHLDRIFDPFFTTKQKGNGLGLATSFSIARSHEGHISVESALGDGSIFYLYLPASSKTATQPPEKKVKMKAASNARIMIMDDEEAVRDIASRMLKRIGYENVDCVEDGAEAVKLYKEAMASGETFSLVILDLTIPGGMGGMRWSPKFGQVVK